jgi:riboflavin-specific deaminase-like protein
MVRAERPQVSVHFAQTLDGHIDRPSESESAVISNREGFRLAHERRATHDAVLIGIRTVLRDDPKLRVTRVVGPNPHRVVLDSHLRTPSDARLLERDQDERVVIFASRDHAAGRALAELGRRGAEVVLIDRGPTGLLDIRAALHWLVDNGIATLLVEGGARTIASFLDARAVDRMSVEIAPRFIGASGLPALGGFPSGFELRSTTVQPLGGHVLVSGIPVLR